MNTLHTGSTTESDSRSNKSRRYHTAHGTHSRVTDARFQTRKSALATQQHRSRKVKIKENLQVGSGRARVTDPDPDVILPASPSLLLRAGPGAPRSCGAERGCHWSRGWISWMSSRACVRCLGGSLHWRLQGRGVH